MSKNYDDPRTVYADIIDLPHHRSEKHPRMSHYNRAAQFMPFAALSGYEDMVREAERVTDNEHDISEDQQDILKRKLDIISDIIDSGGHPEISVAYFVPDNRKTGGSYEEHTGTVKKIDNIHHNIIFCSDNGISDGRMISLGKIADISFIREGESDNIP